MIVLDTSILIDHLRGSPDALSVISEAAQAGDQFVVSVLTKVEVLAGMRTRERRSVRDLFEVLTWVTVDDEIADEAGRLARRFRASHPGVDVVDYVIAATANHLGATIWTRNVKHFPMFAGLVSPY